MKRSEMVKIIARELRTQSSGNSNIDPDLVLLIIEASGMLPPDINSKFTDNLGDFLIMNEWEKE